MPATTLEIEGWKDECVAGRLVPWRLPTWADGTRATEAEVRYVFATLQGTEARRLDHQTVLRTGSQRRARAFLRQFLTPVQRTELRKCGFFRLQTLNGNWYELHPALGKVCRILPRHGRFFRVTSYCLHAAQELLLPPADETLAHLLLLQTSETEFLALANATTSHPANWQRSFRRYRQAMQAAALDLNVRLTLTESWPDTEEEYCGLIDEVLLRLPLPRYRTAAPPSAYELLGRAQPDD